MYENNWQLLELWTHHCVIIINLCCLWIYNLKHKYGSDFIQCLGLRRNKNMNMPFPDTSSLTSCCLERDVDNNLAGAEASSNICFKKSSDSCRQNQSSKTVWENTRKQSSHPGVWLLVEDEFECVGLRLTGTVQTHVAAHSISRTSRWRRGGK